MGTRIMANSGSKSSWVLIDRIITNALEEDIGSGDITTTSLIPKSAISNASLTAKSDFILAGLPFAKRTFMLIDKNLKFKSLKKDGNYVKKGTIVATIKGSTRSLLTAERTALNILQRLCGIATLTNDYVKAVKGFRAKIVDTRKTVPGLRFFDKHAVKAGNGTNHRFGLFDGVLIKDNHIAAAGGITIAIKHARSKAHHLLKIEIEVKNLKEVREAVAANADIIMLDNMHLIIFFWN